MSRYPMWFVQEMQEMSGANELYEEEHQEEHDAPVGERGYPSCEEITWPEIDDGPEYAQTYQDVLAEEDSERAWPEFIGDDVDASAAVDRDADRGPVVARRMGHPLYADDFDDDMPF
jgi:hypothetical protein